jgi:polysaccharide deacetylase 2 family uncharacterized protein YibQ
MSDVVCVLVVASKCATVRVGTKRARRGNKGCHTKGSFAELLHTPNQPTSQPTNQPPTLTTAKNKKEQQQQQQQHLQQTKETKRTNA